MSAAPLKRRLAVLAVLALWAGSATLACHAADAPPQLGDDANAAPAGLSTSTPTSAPASASASPSTALPGGELRLRWDARSPGLHGPLAAAHALSPTVAPPARDGAVVELLLRHQASVPLAGQGVALSGELLAWQQRLAGDHTAGVANGGLRLNELQASAEHGAWGLSAGKKVVAWDVGFGFRPNDVVQQEARRTLLASPLEGRPLLQAEHFGADSATALVWVNPQQLNADADDSRGATESALALRHYRHDGALDVHGFARWGAHTGASLGAALAWVAGDAWALHGSLRVMQRHDGWAAPPLAPAALARQNPWQPTTLGAAGQALLGLQWTGEAQQSLLIEAWHDGTAPTAAEWQAWRTRNAALGNPALGSSPAPAAARAGNLAWQAGVFNNTNLQRDSLFLRLAWQPERWLLSLDALLHPADRGHTLTASLQWQGEHLRLNAALRWIGGPAEAALAQLPQRRLGLVAATWAF